jgi:hypothetical protein
MGTKQYVAISTVDGVAYGLGETPTHACEDALASLGLTAESAEADQVWETLEAHLASAEVVAKLRWSSHVQPVIVDGVAVLGA